MNNEYAKLLQDVEPEITWAGAALQLKPDAINLWIGNSYSVTDLHKDPYENIFCQILGKKHFVLLPPFSMACVNEQMLPVACYRRVSMCHHSYSQVLIWPILLIKVLPRARRRQFGDIWRSARSGARSDSRSCAMRNLGSGCPLSGCYKVLSSLHTIARRFASWGRSVSSSIMVSNTKGNGIPS